MSSVNIEELFDEHRYPTGLGLLSTIFYSPIGLILLILRLFIGFHALLTACILPKASKFRQSVLRTMCSVLGIFVAQTDEQNRDEEANVLVANYTSTLDHLALDLILPNVLPSVWDLPSMLMWLLGYTNMGAKQGRETLIRNAKNHCRTSSLPILAFPEGASTNGKKGLLKFSVWPFSLNRPIQPVLIQIRRPSFVKISPSVIGGRWWIDVFWFLFVPYTVFHIRFLRSVQLNEETEEEFTVRIQQLMARELGVQPTVHTSVDKVEYMKRKLISQEPQVERQPQEGSGSSEIDQMCRQVLEVLPHVPANVVKRDLAMTKDVDLTITHLLEGNVEFTPLEGSIGASPAHSPSPSSSPPPNKNVVAAKFGKNYKDRQLSFEERKKALIESARLRYIEKHGIAEV
ncbi:hypothetical protein CAPTEDRAFT_227093 [Capitella teleta]|uniref:Lipid droplet-regulating VLDL assembly factor AUP1 n=1 Tax=Capitella teleta TaxID=283909 RepID=R7U2I7_CAPTE|nr:hypothetical protein CAPTEDRAFT_227093 [Capitella teleta]|eukprot:ELU00555.1 hypothetical protein CAPTEDRAFT_227093 [Capitella teleta]